MPRPVLAALALVVPLLREVREMLYQNDDDYVFSSEKFMRRYPDFDVTPYTAGIEAMVASLRAAPPTVPSASACTSAYASPSPSPSPPPTTAR